MRASIICDARIHPLGMVCQKESVLYGVFSWTISPSVKKTVWQTVFSEESLIGPTKRKHALRRVPFWWTIRDSNPGPTGYEPVALTN